MDEVMWWKLRRKNFQFLLALIAGFSAFLVMAAGWSQRINESAGLAARFDLANRGLKGWKLEACCQYSVQPNRIYHRLIGHDSVRFELRRTDPTISGGKRSEIRFKPVPANSENWYGFSLRLDSNWEMDRSFDIVAQWHSLPDADRGESWRTPPLYFTTRLNQLQIMNRWDPKPVTQKNDPRPEGGIAQLWEGTFTPGMWTDWVVHAKWSSQEDGRLQIWRNGTLIVNKFGPNTYNDEHGPFFKIGLYKPDWAHNPRKSTADIRVLYVDEIRMTGSSGTYASVAPKLID